MKSINKKLRIQSQLKREANFINQWPITSKPLSYNSLNDKHAEYHFELPSVQKHFRRIQKIATKQQSSQTSDLLQRIQRSSFILNQRKGQQIHKSQQYESKKPRQNLRYYQRQTGNYSTVKNRYGNKQQHNNNDKSNQSVGNRDRGTFSFSEIIQRYSTVRRLPSIEATTPNSSKAKTKNQYCFRNTIMQDIIRRRKQKTLEQ